MPGSVINDKATSCNGCGTLFHRGSGRGWNNRLFCETCLARGDHPARMNKDKHLRRAYSLTLWEFTSLLERQGAACAICETPLTTEHKNMIAGEPRPNNSALVDHCHQTGRVRGLLCHRCNIAVGHLQDSPKNALRTAHYLATSMGR